MRDGLLFIFCRERLERSLPGLCHGLIVIFFVSGIDIASVYNIYWPIDVEVIIGLHAVL